MGSLFLVSPGKNSTKTSQHIVIQVIWRNTRLLHLSLATYSDHDWDFSASRGLFQRAHVSIGCSTLHLLATGDVETSDVSYVLKLSSGDLTSQVAGYTISQLETNWDGPVHSDVTFPATVLSCGGSLVKTGFKGRATTNELNMSRRKNREGRVRRNCLLRSLMLKQAWFPYVAFTSFKL